MAVNTRFEPIIIPLNKTKLTLMFAGSLIFVALGLWFICSPATFSRYSVIAVTITGIAAVAFFGACAIAVVVKLFSTKPGLIIDETGITDNSSGLSAGLIPWNDINGFEITKVSRQQFITIQVKNPDEYISRQGNFLKRKAAQMNNNLYSSPINISTNGLKYDFDALYQLLRQRLSLVGKYTIDQ